MWSHEILLIVVVTYLTHCVLGYEEYSFPSFDWFKEPNDKKNHESKNSFSEQKPESYKNLDKSTNPNYFSGKHEVDKGQVLEDFNFNSHSENSKGQDLQKFHFGQSPKGQETEEFDFGSKPKETNGEQLEKWDFGPSKGQEIEEIKFGSEPEKLKGQELEDFNFGSNHKELKGQELEKWDFGPAKGQEIEEIKFGSEPEKLKGQEVEEIDFGSKLKKPLGQKIEEINFGEKPAHNKSEEIESLFGETLGGQNIEEINFGSKPAKIKAKEPEVLDFGSKPEGQKVEDVVFDKPLKENENQKTEELHFESISNQLKGQEIEEINFGNNSNQHLIKKDCKDLPAVPLNSILSCDNFRQKCKTICYEGYEFSDGQKEWRFECINGQWMPAFHSNKDELKCREKNLQHSNFESNTNKIFNEFDKFYNVQTSHPIVINEEKREPKECSIWNNDHYRTFDGKVYSFESDNCSYILTQDVENTLKIVKKTSKCLADNCIVLLKIFYQEKQYILHYKENKFIFEVDGHVERVPLQLDGVLVEQKNDRISLSLQFVEIKLIWTNKNHIYIRANGNMWNKLKGLCGNFNSNLEDEFNVNFASNFQSFLFHWKDDNIENIDTCNPNAALSNELCDSKGASDFCEKIFGDIVFQHCLEVEELKIYKNVCVWDICKCGKKCACESIEEFVRSCKKYLVNENMPDSTSDWREITQCTLECPPGQVYSICGPTMQPTCGSVETTKLARYSECSEGCFCPGETVLFNNTCIKKETCPCQWKTKHYFHREKIQKDCNTCNCENGEWRCSNLKCGARCSLTGNAHYLTFDGKRYDFKGTCSYYLLKNSEYDIIVSHFPCSEEFYNYPGETLKSFGADHSLCINSISIHQGLNNIKLKKHEEVLVNGVEVSSIPADVDGVIIRKVSTAHIVVSLPDEVEVWWDGNSNVYIDLPINYEKKTGGLCGTFNGNQKDDFLTPEGDIEQIPTTFVEKWKSEETCIETVNGWLYDPCDINKNSKIKAEKYCRKLKDTIFKECHQYVDVEDFYKNCLHDVCSCQKEAKNCFCPIFSDYAIECSKQGVEIPWRVEIRECGMHCPLGQTYQPCGNSCTRSCQDIAINNGHCNSKCVDGCNCPEGLTLSSTGQCIPISTCPCFHQNLKYKAGQEIIKENSEGSQFCVCDHAKWSCRVATKLEIARDYENSNLKCNSTRHEEYTTCEPAEPKTCKNMHEKPKQSTRICFPGCVCKKGYVWDAIGKKCVPALECPCHHGGKSYADGEQIQEDCNTCVCENGIWKCTEKKCASICSTWGDTHFKTFDGRIYDFQGSCEFVLAGGSLSDYDSFFISLEILPCGSTGISCPKSITLKVGPPSNEEKVVFSKSNSFLIPKGLGRILVREAGLFIFADVIDLGITLQWDKGTRVSVKASSKWQNKIKGLCGNFNDNAMDDFKTPFSGETNEVSPILFADSWRIYSYCPESYPTVDTCGLRPHRKSWAVNKCSILKSEIFEPCSSEVPIDSYFERCLTDACGCDEGGDCECLCTAIAAYAQECILHGVPIKWRSQEFCPMQCDDSDSKYSPCFSTCPPKSCDNHHQQYALQKTCSLEPCVEGCHKKSCPDGHVLENSQSNKCIPIEFCKSKCLTVNNVTYLEGDLMESDDCHSCFCSRHKKVCTGKPCSLSTIPIQKEVVTTERTIKEINDIYTTTSPCPPGQIWHDCFINCDYICSNLKHDSWIREKCHRGEHCLSGCRLVGFECPPGMFLRDDKTCVHKKDCPCLSSNGSFVKPGEVIEVTDCEKCQCINNEYECTSTCSSLMPTISHPINYTEKVFTTTQKIDFGESKNITYTRHTTSTPIYSFCPSAQFESLISDFTKFSASSSLNKYSTPEHANMHLPQGHWAPASDTSSEYLQIDLGRVEPVYAVNIAGGSGKYVTGFHLKYSLNGHKFVDVINKDHKEEIFGGPFDGHHSIKVVLPEPIEARYIRFHPFSWNGGIAMKVDILGCKDLEISSTPFFTTSIPLICHEPIGIGEKYFPKLHLSVTSSKSQTNFEHIGLHGEGWQPLANSKSEYLQLDFGEFANLTGILTKGIPQSNDLIWNFREDSWVERYKVMYSSDEITWNPVLDDFGNEMIFMGNIDSSTIQKNLFKRPIRTKALRILPIKWHENIALRIDVLGCYEPTILEGKVTLPPSHPKLNCNICEGTPESLKNCNCKEEQWWDGEKCITHSECPCFVGFIAYPVGTTFTTEKCEECLCRMYGIPHCTPKVCDACPQGLQKSLTSLCGCTCKTCEENTRLCPTSNICLEESAWCNGIEDCPDDEVNCTTPLPKVSNESKPCNPSCPEGYSIVYRTNQSGPIEIDNMFEGRSYLHMKSLKTKKSVKTYKNSKKTKKRVKLSKFADCPSYDCVPVKEETTLECPMPACPKNYLVEMKKTTALETSCPKFECEPLPEFANCTVSSRHIKTFDGTEYKYEICDHVLTRHNEGFWNVSMLKICKYNTPCVPELVIHHDNHIIELHSHNQIIKLDSFAFNENQMDVLNTKAEDFIINIMGNSMIFTSLKYGFDVVFDFNGNFKIKVASSSKEHLSGLCGFYNGNSQDDKTLPDGKLSKTIVEFGDSWLNPGGKECVETFCPLESQNVAFQICSLLRETPFSFCGQEVNFEQCIENTCNCLASNNTEDDCKCATLTEYAVKCSSPELFGWRVDYNCPTFCAPHLVYYDCYPYACEPTCTNKEECANPATECYSGCFCPDGLVKKGDQCIKVPECRDCICSGMGDSTYLTFDGGLTFNGNCTYVAVRNKNSSVNFQFEVLITNGLCSRSNFLTCTEKVEIKVSGHSIKLTAPQGKNRVMVDGSEQDIQTAKNFIDWAKIEFNPVVPSIDVNLPKEHVGVRYFYKKFAFTISLPSHYYSGRVEGLCGTCTENINPEDVEGPDVWQIEKDKNCFIEPPNECFPTAEHEKICFAMNDPKIFGQCLAVVDSAPFIDQCLASLCFNGHICNSFEAFGTACRDAGICVDWRSSDFCPFTCSPGLEYEFCKSGCTKTCENVIDNSDNCSNPPVEGCFCPKDEIFINGTCQPEKFCKFCDEEGKHFEGDSWHVDKCTQCLCKNRTVICNTKECHIPEINCKENEILKAKDDNRECCPKYECVCKAKDECPKIEMPVEVLPVGMEAVINESECCPKVELVCKTELCPMPKPCRNHYIKRVINTTECCPEHLCERPANLCFYEPDEANHFMTHSRSERQVHEESVKHVGEKWFDGPCKSCACIEKEGYAEAVCSITECPALESHKDFEEYELNSVYNPNKCCPEIERTHCKHDGHLYKVGDSWLPDEKRPCETMKCNKMESGMIIKETRVQICNSECDLGWEYRKAEAECCGHCHQAGCVAENKVYKSGEMWLSENGCAKNTCTYTNGSFSISTMMESCPSIEDCPEEHLYQEKCCLKCKIKSESKKICLPQSLPPDSTVHMVMEKKGRHGMCRNMLPLQNFTQCAGNCDSYTQFKSETFTHESVCKCCQPEEYSLMVVGLTCDDGLEIMKTLTVPSKCACVPCGA